MSLPGKIVCIGRNYVEHIHELGNAIPDQMVVFNKPGSSLSQHLYAQHQGDRLHYEAEICLRMTEQGLTQAAVGLDLTKRMLQSQLKQAGLPWERAKAFDGAVVMSDFIDISEAQISQLGVRLLIDGKQVQHGEVKHMMYPPLMAVQELVTFMALQPGDWLMTGTPKGVGEVHAGAEFTAQLLLSQEVIVSQRWRARDNLTV